MRKRISVANLIVCSLVAATTLASPQNKASVQMANLGPFHPGEPIAFNVKLNAPMPKGAHFAFRISPVSTDDEIDLGSGQPVNATQTEFRVSGRLPESAVPGRWHIAVIWLFLPGVSWTHSAIAPNDVTFDVEGKPYPIPTRAQVTLAH